MTSITSIGQEIAEARRRQGMRQTDLAMQARVSRATIDALENARARDIGVSRLIRMLAALGLELNIRPSSDRRPTLDDLLKDDHD